MLFFNLHVVRNFNLTEPSMRLFLYQQHLQSLALELSSNLASVRVASLPAATKLVEKMPEDLLLLDLLAS